MFKRKKKKTGCETPKFRRPTAPLMPPVKPPNPPTSGSNAAKPNNPCAYETPCGWCAKWDKKCDKKIGCDNTPNAKAFGKHTRTELVAMEELLDKYHKLYGQEKFTHQENNQ